MIESDESPSPIYVLASDPTGRKLGIELPPGSVVDDVDGRPTLWLSDDPVGPEQLGALFTEAVHAGLRPVVLNGEGLAQPLRPAGTDAPVEDVLATWATRFKPRQEEHDPSECESCQAVIDFHRTQPGADLAEGGLAPDSIAALVAAMVLPFAPRLGLVACTHSSEVPSVLGWDGPANYHDPISWYSTVLHRWEDAFGARVVALHGASLVCSVASPPADFDSAHALAREQLAFCPDLAGEFESVNAHAESLIRRSAWAFWWD